MATRRIKTESIENLKRVVDAKDDNVDVVGDMGVVMADAYAESIQNEEHVSEVKDELEKKADEIKTENPDTGKEVKNEFTAKLVLDEDIEDYREAVEQPKQKRVYEDSPIEVYYDMDMFEFIYELVTISDARRKPIDPLGRPHARFQISGRDKYAGLSVDQMKALRDEEGKETSISAPQVGTGSNYIDVYSLYYKDMEDPDFRFRDIIAICDLYGFKYEGPQDTYRRKRNRWAMAGEHEFLHWDRYVRIYVPCLDNGYPMMIDEYFETRGLTIEDVMNPEFCKHYRKIEASIEKEAQKMIADREKEQAKKAKIQSQADNDAAVNKIVDDAIVYASLNGDIDLKIVKRKMYSDLKSAGLTYKKADVDSKFDAAFADDYDDEDE